MDTLTKKERSALMSSIRSSGTKPEKRLAEAVREWERRPPTGMSGTMLTR